MNTIAIASKLNPTNPKILGAPLNLRAKFSQSGRFLGWYRPNQKSGNPSKSLLFAGIHSQEMAFNKQMQSVLEYFEKRHVSLGKLSGVARRKNGLQAQIIERYKQLQDQGNFPKHHLAKLLARELDTTPKYVNRVMLAERKRTPERHQDTK